jgi:hypothetical protein
MIHPFKPNRLGPANSQRQLKNGIKEHATDEFNPRGDRLRYERGNHSEIAQRQYLIGYSRTFDETRKCHSSIRRISADAIQARHTWLPGISCQGWLSPAASYGPLSRFFSIRSEIERERFAMMRK